MCTRQCCYRQHAVIKARAPEYHIRSPIRPDFMFLTSNRNGEQFSRALSELLFNGGQPFLRQIQGRMASGF